MPLEPSPGPLRRIVEALFQTPLGLAQPVRGGLLYYRTPTLAIQLSARRMPGGRRAWVLRGELRTHDGQRLVGVIESIAIQRTDALDQTAIAGTIEASGVFAIADLAAGTYQLSLTTADEEIIIRRLEIGDSIS